MNRLAAGILLLAATLAGCTGLPPGITPVEDFDVNRYLGRWYEIARLDHAFERGLERVTADYSLRDDGGLRVVNSGYPAGSGTARTAEGRAYFVSGSTTGHLKVSFFGPFFGSYVIFELGEGYDHALVTSHNRDYLWLLARSPSVDQAVRDRFVAVATELGFDTRALIFVRQDP